MADLPTGTVTFLFTDIEGSTRRWDDDPEAMREVLARHDALLRGVMEAHGGHIFKTMGDAFCAAFATAPQALASAAAAQRAIAAEDWGELGPLRVRMALHTGVAEVRDRDYFGPPLNRVARLLSAGYGGQTLLSLATAELTRDQLPNGASLRDLGEHRLRDLQRPERIFQLILPELPDTFPPLKTLQNRPNNLPAQPTPLVGREHELNSVRALILRADVWLVTLTGPGGVGKTRLALHAAADLLEDFPGGVYLVNLAPLVESRMVLSTIAQALGVVDSGNQPLIEGVKQRLIERPTLLVLDNFEHLVEAAPLLVELRESCTRLKFLATSRMPLHLRGEHEYAVLPLRVPDHNQPRLLEALSQYAALELFIQRAVAVQSQFAVTNETVPAVAEICHRLDGLPLAIELAAAWIKLFSPDALLRRLERRLPVLVCGSRDLPVRQQTLRGAIAWSYDLLSEPEQALLRWLSVFAGGCTLDAAETVCGSAGEIQITILDGLATLVDHSLLRQDEQTDGEPRFWMLETIREFGLERLAASGQLDAAQRAHARYFSRLVEEAVPQLRGPAQLEWLDRLELEHDNLLAALRWAESSDLMSALGLAGSLHPYWESRGHVSEGRWWLDRLIATTGYAGDRGSIPTSANAPRWEHSENLVGDRVLADALNAAGSLSELQGDYRNATAYLERSLALGRALEDQARIATALRNLGFAAVRQGDYPRAAELLGESLHIGRTREDRWELAQTVGAMGIMAAEQGDYDRAAGLMEESLAIFRSLGDRRNVARSLINLANVAMRRGAGDRAASLLEESLSLSRELRETGAVANTLLNLGVLVYDNGEYDRAAQLWDQSVALHKELGRTREVAIALWNQARVAHLRAQYDRAETLYVESLSLWWRLGLRVDIPPYLERLADVALRRGKVERAARLLGAAEARREATGVPLEADEGLDYERVVVAARAALPGDAFRAEWMAGRGLSIEDAVAYALEIHQPPVRDGTHEVHSPKSTQSQPS